MAERLVLTVDEVAELLGCGRSTVHRLIRNGHLPAVSLSAAARPGLRVSRRALEEFIGAGGAMPAASERRTA